MRATEIPELRTVTIARDIAEEEAADAYDAARRGCGSAPRDGGAQARCDPGARSAAGGAGLEVLRRDGTVRENTTTGCPLSAFSAPAS